MSDLPRFENVDLTPTWDDVDPAELDFGSGALDAGIDTVADVTALDPPGMADADVVDVELPPEPPDVEDADTDAELADAPTDIEVEAVEPTEQIDADSGDDYDGLDGMSFDGPIGADSAPDDFDL